MLNILKLIGLILILSSCNVEEVETSELPLRQIINKEVKTGHSSAHFFLIVGGYKKGEDIENIVKVFAKVGSTYRLIIFDLENTKISIDNTVKIPYIKISLLENTKASNTQIVERLKYTRNHGGFYEVTIVCPEQYLPEQLIPINL